MYIFLYNRKIMLTFYIQDDTSKNSSSQSKNEKDESIKENSTSQNQNQTPNSNSNSVATSEKPSHMSVLKNARNLTNINEYDDDLPAMVRCMKY